MSAQSRELDKKLAEILTPHGFKRAKGTRCFLRLWGEDLIQGIGWIYDPRHFALSLICPIKSLHDHPRTLLQNNFQTRPRIGLYGGVDCSEYKFISEYDVVRPETTQPSDEESLAIATDLWNGNRNRHLDFLHSADEQLAMMQKEILPRFERWKTPLDVIKAHMGEFYEVIAMVGKDWAYKFSGEINIMLLTKQYDEALRYIEHRIKSCGEDAERALAAAQEFSDRKKRCRSEKSIAEAEALIDAYTHLLLSSRAESEAMVILKRWILEEPEQIDMYLQNCKEQNLRDYEAVMNNLPGDNLEYEWPNKARHPNWYEEAPKEMAKRYLACKNFYGD